jgi:hypothetical protein
MKQMAYADRSPNSRGADRNKKFGPCGELLLGLYHAPAIPLGKGSPLETRNLSWSDSSGVAVSCGLSAHAEPVDSPDCLPLRSASVGPTAC